MFKIKGLGPVYSQAPAEGAAQGGGGQQLPAGVQPGSAAAQAIEAKQGQQTPPADDAGKGGKDAVLADLAKERQQRHALEEQLKATNTTLEQLKAGLGQALGVQNQQVTPEQLQAQAQQVQAQQQTAMTQLAVYQIAPTAGADAAKLMDSASFLNSIKDLQPTDHAGISAAIKTALERNKTLAAGRVGAGANDAGAGGSGGAQQPTMSDLIRAAAGFGGQ